jgi:O-antigen/teichoic acid export membrane protein
MLCWMLSGWSPGWPSRHSGVMPMLKYGGNLTGFNVLNYANRNADNVIIGWGLGAGLLGIYSKAYALLLMPMQQINAPIAAVALPALSRLQHEPERYRSYYVQAIQLIALIGMPIVAYAFADATHLIMAILGPQWIDAVPIFRALAPAALAGTLNVAPGWILVSLGQSDRLFRWSLISTPVTLGAFAIGLQWGVLGVATAFSVAFCGLMIGMMFYACRQSPVPIHALAGAVLRPLTASILTAACFLLLATERMAMEHTIPRLLVGMVLFGCVYIVWLAMMPGGAGALKRAGALVRSIRAGQP